MDGEGGVKSRLHVVISGTFLRAVGGRALQVKQKEETVDDDIIETKALTTTTTTSLRKPVVRLLPDLPKPCPRDISLGCKAQCRPAFDLRLRFSCPQVGMGQVDSQTYKQSSARSLSL